MNKKIYNEDLTLNLILNGDKMKKGSQEALNQLYKMDQETRKLQLSIAKLELEKRRMDKTDSDYANKLNLINTQIDALNAKVKSNYQAMMQLRREIGLSGMTINQLNSHLKVLKASLANATDPKIIKALRKEIDETNIRLTTMTTGAGRLSQAWTQLARNANKYSAAIGWISIIAFAVGTSIGNLIDRLSGLDRKLSEVMKTTGLTREEARRMKQEFDHMTTPTASDDLLGMAKVAGKLGIEGYENIKKFTGAIDVLYTALGSDLNLSVEETAEKVGKLVNAFRITDKMPLDEALLRAGSLLNELDKSSAASAGTILEYMTRLSSLGTTANYPIEKLAGLAAAMETVNIPAERGSTALRNIIGGLGKFADKFARILGVSVEQYKQMVKDDINGVFLKLVQLTAKGDESIVDLVKSMGDMEVSGVRVAEVYSAIAQNIDVINRQQGIATTAFETSASVMGEYNIIINDYLGNIDTQKKRVRALSDEYNQRLAPSALNLYKLWVDFLYLLSDLADWLYEHSNLIKSLASLYVAWKSVAIASWITDMWKTLKTYTWYIYENIKAIIANNTVLIAYQRHGIRGAIVALRQLWVTMAANPMAPLIAIVGVAAAAFYAFSGKVSVVKKAMGDLSASIIEQRSQMERVFEAAEQSLPGTDKHIAAIKALNELYGKYLPNLLSEKDGIDAITTARRAAISALEDEIALKWENETFAKIRQDNAEKRNKELEGMLNLIPKEKRGMAMYDLFRKTQEVMEGKNTSSAEEMAAMFRKDWLVNSRSDDDDIASKYASNYFKLIFSQQGEEKMLRDFRAQYSAAGKKGIPLGGESSGGPLESIKGGAPFIDEDAYKVEKGKLEARLKERQEAISMSMSDQTKLQETFDRENLEAEAQYWKELSALQAHAEVKDKEEANASFKYQDTIRKIRNAKVKEQIAIEEKAHNIRMGNIQREYLQSEVKNEDEYNEAILKEELDFLGRKLGLLTEGSEEYIAVQNEILSKKVQVEKSIDDKIAAAQKQFASVKNDRIKDQVEKELTIEENRWTEEKQGLERQLIVKKELSAKELQYNEIIHKLIEEKEAEHQTKLNQIKSVNDKPKLNAITNALSGMSEVDRDTTFFDDQQMQDHFAQRAALLKEKYDLEKKMAGDNAEAVAEAEKNYNTASFDLKKELFDAEKRMHEAKMQMAQSYVSALIQVVGQQSALGKALFLFNQGLAIADVWIKANAANAAITSKAMEMFAYLGPLAPAAAGAWAAAPLAANNTSAVLSSGLIAAQTVGTIVSQWEKGRYPVIGEDDGRQYMAKWMGNATTGIYGTPSLVAEKGPEMIIDYPTLKNIQMNAPGLIQAIMERRVPQFAGGRYEARGMEHGAWNRSSWSDAQGSGTFITEQTARDFIRGVNRLLKWKPSVSVKEFKEIEDNYDKTTSGGLK